MEKLPMCRICLVQNVRMYPVVNRNFHELYEKLTDIRFVTEDRRPILACFFCFAKLKQCWRFLRKCLEAEELFAQMMNEDYEPKPLINQDHSEHLGGFIKSPVENISIVDVVQTESIAIKEKLPAVCEGPDDIIEPKEHQSDECEVSLMEFKTEVKEEEVSESYLEYEVPLMEFKTEVEEDQEVSMKKQRAREMISATVTKKTKLEHAITAEQMKNENSESKVIRITEKRTSKPGTSCKEPNKCDQRSINRVKKNTQHTRTQIGEKTYKCEVCLRSFSRKCGLTKHFRIHTGEKPYKCDVCQRSFRQKTHLTEHIRIHTGEKSYKCDLCSRSFSQKVYLKTHIRVHSGEKPFMCDICLRSFSRKYDLIKHIRVHTGEKPYTCDVCQRSFSQKIHLTEHYRLHTGEKPYRCDVCQRSFNLKCDLTKHFRIHTGAKPYKCDVCQKSFNQKNNLTRHNYSCVHVSKQL